MTFVVALLCWFLLSFAAAVVIGRMLRGPIPAAAPPHAPGQDERFGVRSNIS